MSFYSMHFAKIKPSQASTHFNKIKLEINACVQEMLDAFGKKFAEKQKDIWVSRLIAQDFTLAEVKGAIDHSIETLKFMPSYSEFKNSIQSKQNREKGEDELEVKRLKLLEAENKRFEKGMAIFLKNSSPEAWQEYYMRWLNANFGDDVLINLKTYGLSSKLFERCALFDWQDANGNNMQNVFKYKQEQVSQMLLDGGERPMQFSRYKTIDL